MTALQLHHTLTETQFRGKESVILVKLHISNALGMYNEIIPLSLTTVPASLPALSKIINGEQEAQEPNRL